MPTDDELLLAELLGLALDTARQVGEDLLGARRAAVPGATTKSSVTDMVTEMDLWAEQAIVSRLLDARPGDGIHGEEGTEVAGTTGVRWCIDPIDGTTNYLYDHPGWSVSIAALLGGTPVVGVVADPELDQVFSAVRGHGAWRDGRPIRVSDAAELQTALVGTGFGYHPGRRAIQGAVVSRVLPRVRDIRRMGGAAVDLCSVGCGRLDAFYEYGLNPWDVAAGGLVAVEGGARLTDLEGNPSWSGMIVAAGPGLHDALLALLREVRADEAANAG